VDHISCHATSTPAGDTAEATAISRLFSDDQRQIDRVSIAATKSQLGHTFGAAGAIESIFAILSLKNVFKNKKIKYKFF
jgi:3-oxoacyl-[acyl-carrier-protein] synthase II